MAVRLPPPTSPTAAACVSPCACPAEAPTLSNSPHARTTVPPRCRQIATWYFPLESVQLGDENTVRTTVSDFCRVGYRGSNAQKLRETERTYQREIWGSTRARVTAAPNLL